jgi:MOSC domain-containing protein YiiM
VGWSTGATRTGTVEAVSVDAAHGIGEVTGLRNPCKQLDEIHPGLKKAVLGRDENGEPVRLAGIMGVVRRGGRVAPGDGIQVELPPAPHQPLHPV